MNYQRQRFDASTNTTVDIDYRTRKTASLPGVRQPIPLYPSQGNDILDSPTPVCMSHALHLPQNGKNKVNLFCRCSRPKYAMVGRSIQNRKRYRPGSCCDMSAFNPPDPVATASGFCIRLVGADSNHSHRQANEVSQVCHCPSQLYIVFRE
jgi:hypothetical protein